MNYYQEISQVEYRSKDGNETKVFDALEWPRQKVAGCTFHWAAGEGNTEVAKLLIANGADVNAKGKSNWTPLRWAEARKRQDIVNILKSAGAKP